MPYIKPEDRSKFTELVHALYDVYKPETPGELNYALTLVIQSYLSGKKESYGVYSEVVSALECCKLEFYRRKVSQLEATKIKENGDVY